MPKLSQNEYDAVIIGAGIGGLVCGCYLAKAGMKVLIAEQHNKPGGYCTSFKRHGFTFDAAAHSFGGYRHGGLVRKVFEDLGIGQRLKITQSDPSDIIITSDYNLAFRSDVDETIKNFQSAFPNERDNIRSFFSSLRNPVPTAFLGMRKWTFKDLLDKYFTDGKLKSVLGFPLFGNGGLPPSRLSVFVGVNIFTEFLLDGGYYPGDGMYALPLALGDRFKEFGGTLLLSCPAKKIEIKDNKISGVQVGEYGFIPSKYTVSNCDARQTFFKLIGKGVLNHDLLNRIERMTPSLSGFIVYLGIDASLDELPPNRVTLWCMSHYDTDKTYDAARKGDFTNIGGHMVHVSPKQKSIMVFINAPFKNMMYWNTHRVKLMDSIINKIEEMFIQGLSRHIVYKNSATPHTLYRYTLNYQGAAYGWAGLPSQIAITDFRTPPFARGLYLTGHWTTQGLGIPGVIYSGYDTAKSILRDSR